MAKAGRRRLVDSAVAVISRDGVAGLTLDAVAAEAGVSKGGLLYHFPTKQALLQGVVATVLDDWHESVAGLAAAEPDQAGGAARAYVRACSEDKAGLEANFALLAILAIDRDQAETWRQLASTWADEDKDDLDLTLARLAADGLWLATLFDLYGVRGDRRSAVVDRILELTQKGAPR